VRASKNSRNLTIVTVMLAAGEFAVASFFVAVMRGAMRPHYCGGLGCTLHVFVLLMASRAPRRWIVLRGMGYNRVVRWPGVGRKFLVKYLEPQ